MEPDASARVEEELSHRELLLSEAERIVHLGSWMWDTGTNAIRWSDELYRIFGLAPRSVEPTVERFFGFIAPADLEKVREVTGRGLATANPEPVDFRIVRPDGVTRHVHMEAALVKRADSMLLVGTLLDVTDQVDLEQRMRHSQKMEAIGTLAGGVAHDFNNYLQVIFGHVDMMLASASLDARSRASAQQVREAARRCQRLTQQLLAFSRRNLLNKETVDLDQLIDRIEPMIESLVGDRIRIRRFRSRRPVFVECDSASVEQVVLNLASNARDAMPEGGRLTIEVDDTVLAEDTPHLRHGRYARLSVEDDGVGMPSEVIPRVFEPFYTTKPAGHGTGLGLASAWGIIEQSGGTIEVQSAEGRGTTLRVLLPLAEFGGTTVRRDPQGSKATVLVVEDQAQVRSLVRALLEGEGFVVLEAEHGRDALRVVRDCAEVGLVLSDVSMPEMSGVELAAALTTLRGDLPIVLMSGFVDPSVEQLGVPLLRKPFEREELLRVITERLR